MIEPKVHSAISRALPDNHWLLTTVEGDEWACHICHLVIYRRFTSSTSPYGTAVTWVEHGIVLGGERPGSRPVPYLLCLLCWYAHETVFPVTDEWWMLNDDGTPQEPRMTSWVVRNVRHRIDTGIDPDDPPYELADLVRRLPDR